jgi:benzoate membrane transport protein
VTAFKASPADIAPVVLTWLVLLRLARRWAVPGAFVAAAVVIFVDLAQSGRDVARGDLVPVIDVTAPHWTWQAIVGIAIPLYVVTMASQNIPGTAVMASYGYEVPWRSAMTVTGLGTVVGAATGGHAINLAAITAAMTAGPEAGPDRSQRWKASFAAGCSYLVLALVSAALVTLVAVGPPGLLGTVAGLALLGTLGSALVGAMQDGQAREPAVLTLVIAASGVSILGVGSAFWALAVGLVARALLRR